MSTSTTNKRGGHTSIARYGAIGAVSIAAVLAAGLAHAQTVTPTISNVVVTPSAMSADITWTTNENTNSQIAFGTTTPYSTYSGIDTNMVTSHNETITDLVPSTLYHYEVISTDAMGNSTSTSDATFTTPASSTTTEPVISAVTASPIDANDEQITWTTNQSSNSQVLYGTMPSYGSSTTLDTGMVTSHDETMSDLSPDMTYYYEVQSNNGTSTTTSSGMTFTTLASSSTTSTTTTPTDIQALETELNQLEAELSSILQSLFSGVGTTGVTTAPQASIDQNGQSFPAGGTIDFGGRNFDANQSVTVSLNGQTVATALADGGGNFSTGSLSLPSTPGTYTYTFTEASGVTQTATITVT